MSNHIIEIIQNINFLKTLNFQKVYSKSASITYFWNGSARGNRLKPTSPPIILLSLFPTTLYTHRGKNQRANYTFMGMFRDDTESWAHAWQTQITRHGDSRARHFPPRLSGHRPDYQRVIDSARLISRKLPGREAAERKCR